MRPEENDFIKWLNEKFERTGRSKSGLAKAWGVDNAAVSKVLNGTRQLKARERDIAEAYFTDGAEGEEAYSREVPRVGVRFGGIVEAGTFRPDDGMNQDHVFRYIPMAPDPRYPAPEQFAFQVMGDSMENAGLINGMYVLAVDIHAWERLHGQPGDGKLVIVSRTRDHNPERELTVKRLRIFMDRYELQPESPNSAHKPFVSRFPLKEEDQEWSIEAVVVSASWLFV